MDETSGPWSIEHYGFATTSPPDPTPRPGPRAAPASPTRRGRRWRSRAVLALGGGLLSLSLVGGVGGYAVAQAATHDGPGPGVAGVDRPHDGAGRAGPGRR